MAKSKNGASEGLSMSFRQYAQYLKGDLLTGVFLQKLAEQHVSEFQG